MSRLSRQLLFTLFSIIVIVPIGFYSKFYSGSYAFWVNNSLGGVFYEIFWCLAIFLILPKLMPWRIAVVVFLITCGLEFLQLWHPRFLQLLRTSFMGQTILGNSFTWSDFPYYAIGSVFGFFWLQILKLKK